MADKPAEAGASLDPEGLGLLAGCLAFSGFGCFFGIACSEGRGNSSSLRLGDAAFSTWPESVRT